MNKKKAKQQATIDPNLVVVDMAEVDNIKRNVSIIMKEDIKKGDIMRNNSSNTDLRLLKLESTE